MLVVVMVFLFFSALVHYGRRDRLPKNLLVAMIAIAAFVTPSQTTAQTVSPDQNSAVASPPNEQAEVAVPAASSAESSRERPVSWKLLFHNVVADQKHIWTFPARL